MVPLNQWFLHWLLVFISDKLKKRDWTILFHLKFSIRISWKSFMYKIFMFVFVCCRGHWPLGRTIMYPNATTDCWSNLTGRQSNPYWGQPINNSLPKFYHLPPLFSVGPLNLEFFHFGLLNKWLQLLLILKWQRYLAVLQCNYHWEI